MIKPKLQRKNNQARQGKAKQNKSSKAIRPPKHKSANKTACQSSLITHVSHFYRHPESSKPSFRINLRPQSYKRGKDLPLSSGISKRSQCSSKKEFLNKWREANSFASSARDFLMIPITCSSSALARLCRRRWFNALHCSQSSMPRSKSPQSTRVKCRMVASEIPKPSKLSRSNLTREVFYYSILLYIDSTIPRAFRVIIWVLLRRSIDV